MMDKEQIWLLWVVTTGGATVFATAYVSTVAGFITAIAFILLTGVLENRS